MTESDDGSKPFVLRVFSDGDSAPIKKKRRRRLPSLNVVGTDDDEDLENRHTADELQGYIFYHHVVLVHNLNTLSDQLHQWISGEPIANSPKVQMLETLEELCMDLRETLTTATGPMTQAPLWLEKSSTGKPIKGAVEGKARSFSIAGKKFEKIIETAAKITGHDSLDESRRDIIRTLMGDMDDCVKILKQSYPEYIDLAKQTYENNANKDIKDTHRRLLSDLNKLEKHLKNRQPSSPKIQTCLDACGNFISMLTSRHNPLNLKDIWQERTTSGIPMSDMTERNIQLYSPAGQAYNKLFVDCIDLIDDYEKKDKDTILSLLRGMTSKVERLAYSYSNLRGRNR